MVKDLVIFASPGLPEPRVVKSFEVALGPEVELRWIAIPGRSAVFTQAGQQARGKDGRVLPWLVARWAPGSWGSVSLVCFSAGYGLAREVLRHEDDRDELSGLVLLDALHAAFGPTGLPMAAQLEPFVEYARLAIGWRKLFVMGHTDVQTPQTGEGAFASTTQCAAALITAAGEPDGGFIVRAYDEADDAHQKREHGLALTGWGPELVQVLGGWLQAWRDFRAYPGGARIDSTGPALGAGASPGSEAEDAGAPGPGKAPVPSWLDPASTLGARAVAWSLGELAKGICEEPPGSNTGPRVREYLAPCNRNGKLLGLRAGAWCAAAACAAGSAALLPGEQLPHHYRASGLELVADAVERDTWRPKGKPYQPRVGDLAIYGRGAAGGWQRHVVRVLESPGQTGAWRSIGGNENDHWAITERSMADAALLGFIEYP